MTKLTITEALAEIKTLAKRIDKKQEFVQSNIGRPAVVRDPFEKDGGAIARVAAERQSIADLSQRLVSIRVAIQAANQTTSVTILSKTQTIAEWLTWRKEVAPREQSALGSIRAKIKNTRAQAIKNAGAITATETQNIADVILHLDESALAKQIDDLENTLGTLDGALSLTNATTFIEIPD